LEAEGEEMASELGGAAVEFGVGEGGIREGEGGGMRRALSVEMKESVDRGGGGRQRNGSRIESEEELVKFGRREKGETRDGKLRLMKDGSQ
jgi:hypothetical protein